MGNSYFKKKLNDLIYGTQRVKCRFEMENPNEKVVASDACKAISTSNNQKIEYGFNWVISQREVILLTDKNIICGKCIIPLESISSAELVEFSPRYGNSFVLKICTKDNCNYQFGMQYNSEWINQRVLPLTIEKGRIKFSPFSIIIRVFIALYLMYLIYEQFINK
ncbi:MAG: hypothetical protein H6Q15_913 [Bacteroidetes bacterium]|nr:hypothetical protein [Bacteroidota bacterium]